jgi:hypothetical protein
MQIHEITLRPIEEGILRTIGQDIKGAVTEPFQKLKTIANTPGAWTSGTTATAALDQRDRAQADQTIAQQQQQRSAQVLQQTQQRAKQLAQQWAQHIETQQKPQPAQANSVATDPNWRQDALKSAGVKFPQSEAKQRSKSKTSNKNSSWRQDALKSVGAAFDPPPAPRPAAGQMPASVAASRQGKLMLQAYGKPKGGIQDIDEAPQEYTTPSGLVVPGSTKTDQQADKTIGDKFLDWSDQQLVSVIPGTRQEINMDMVRKDPGLLQSVKAAQDKVLKDPSNIQAVEDYFETAMQAMQQLSARFKQSVKPARGSEQAAGLLGRILDQRQLDKIKGLLQNPQLAAQVKIELGIQ